MAFYQINSLLEVLERASVRFNEQSGDLGATLLRIEQVDFLVNALFNFSDVGAPEVLKHHPQPVDERVGTFAPIVGQRNAETRC